MSTLWDRVRPGSCGSCAHFQPPADKHWRGRKNNQRAGRCHLLEVWRSRDDACARHEVRPHTTTPWRFRPVQRKIDRHKVMFYPETIEALLPEASARNMHVCELIRLLIDFAVDDRKLIGTILQETDHASS